MPGVKGKCGGRRAGAGGKKDPNAKGMIGFRPTAAQKAWLEKWSDSPTVALNDFLERGMKFWPDGPYRFGHTPKKKGGAG